MSDGSQTPNALRVVHGGLTAASRAVGGVCRGLVTFGHVVLATAACACLWLQYWYDMYLRPFPLPGGPVVVPGTAGSVITALDGSRLLHHTHLAQVLLPLTSLDDAVLHAHTERKLLAVVVVSEFNSTSQRLLRELLVANTGDVQRYLREKVVAYMVSAWGPEAAALAGLQSLGYPAILVYSCNAAGRSSQDSGGGEDTHCGLRIVSSLEGCACVADLRSYLVECERRYAAWPAS